jgi:hypothetical protein
VKYFAWIEREGYEEGRQIGLREAYHEGLCDGLLESIEAVLEVKFGGAGRKLMMKVKRLKNVFHVQRFLKFLKTAATVEEANEYFEGQTINAEFNVGRLNKNNNL